MPESEYQLAFGVVNLTGTRGSRPASRDWRLPVPGGFGVSVRVCERHLAEESAGETMAAIEAGRTAG